MTPVTHGPLLPGLSQIEVPARYNLPRKRGPYLSGYRSGLEGETRNPYRKRGGSIPMAGAWEAGNEVGLATRAELLAAQTPQPVEVG